MKILLNNSIYGEVMIIAETNFTVCQFKEKISLYFGIEIQYIVLVFKGNILSNEKTLSFYGIKDRSKVFSVFRQEDFVYKFDRPNKYCNFSPEQIKEMLIKNQKAQNKTNITEDEIDERVRFLAHPQGLTEMGKFVDRMHLMAESRCMTKRCIVPKCSYTPQKFAQTTVIPEKAIAPSTDPLPICFSTSNYPIRKTRKNTKGCIPSQINTSTVELIIEPCTGGDNA